MTYFGQFWIFLINFSKINFKWIYYKVYFFILLLHALIKRHCRRILVRKKCRNKLFRWTPSSCLSIIICTACVKFTKISPSKAIKPDIRSTTGNLSPHSNPYSNIIKRLSCINLHISTIYLIEIHSFLANLW